MAVYQERLLKPDADFKFYSIGKEDSATVRHGANL